MKFLIKNLFATVLIAFILFIPVYSFAQGTQTEEAPKTGTQTEEAPSKITSTKINNPINADTIDGFIKTLLEGVLKIGLPIVALAIIYSGFLFVSARGNSESLKKAKSALLYSVIGAAILLGAWAIAQLIANTVLSL